MPFDGRRLALSRTFDATFLNVVANHPEVRPWLGGEGEIDLGPVLANADNVALVTDGGGFVLVRQEGGIYEAHSQFLPDSRGHTRDAMRAVFDYMFTRTDCERIVTQVPDNNRGAMALAKIGRFREMFRLEHTPRGPTAFVGLTLEEWVQDTPALEADGKWFHDPVSQAVKISAPNIPDHPDEPSHDRAVGAAVRMIRAGNVFKGASFYNRWAAFAGFTSMRVLSVAPPIFDVSEPTIGLSCVVGVNGDELEILLCR